MRISLFDKKNVMYSSLNGWKPVDIIDPGLISILLKKIKMPALLIKRDRYWSCDLKSWVIPYKFFKWIYFYKNGITMIEPVKFEPVFAPAIYTLDEIKKEYPNRWLIPIHPEILVKHDGKLLKFSELKQFYDICE